MGAAQDGSAAPRYGTKGTSMRAVDKEVRFVDGDDRLADELDAAYRAKYHRYPANIVDTVLSAEARSATLKLVPL
jgi:hypothetical protein